MGLNPTILRQVLDFAFVLTSRESAAVARRPYRASGLVQGSIPADDDPSKLPDFRPDSFTVWQGIPGGSLEVEQGYARR